MRTTNFEATARPDWPPPPATGTLLELPGIPKTGSTLPSLFTPPCFGLSGSLRILQSWVLRPRASLWTGPGRNPGPGWAVSTGPRCRPLPPARAPILADEPLRTQTRPRNFIELETHGRAVLLPRGSPSPCAPTTRWLARCVPVGVEGFVLPHVAALGY